MIYERKHSIKFDGIVSINTWLFQVPCAEMKSGSTIIAQHPKMIRIWMYMNDNEISKKKWPDIHSNSI